MARMVATFLGLASILAAFYSPAWGWAGIAPPSFALLIILYRKKRTTWRRVPELSPQANAMIRKFGHAYANPIGGRDLSLAASTVMCASMIVALIGLRHAFWAGIAMGTTNGLAMAFAARQFNPANFLLGEAERVAHTEIISLIQRKQAEGRQ